MNSFAAKQKNINSLIDNSFSTHMPAGPQKPAGILTSTTIQVNTIMLFATLLAANAFAQTVDPNVGINDHLDVGDVVTPMQLRPAILNSNGDLVTLPTIGSALNAYYTGSIPFVQGAVVAVQDVYPGDMTQWADNFGTVVASADDLVQADGYQGFPATNLTIGTFMYEENRNVVFACVCPSSCSVADCSYEANIGFGGLEMQCAGECEPMESQTTEESGTSTSDPQNTEGETSDNTSSTTFDECTGASCESEGKRTADDDYHDWLMSIINRGAHGAF